MLLLALVLLVPSPRVYAAVGSGGSGGGGGGGHQSKYGYGWHKYSVGGGGPADGFRDGTHWSSVQNACHKDGANLAIVFVIKDSSGSAMGYDWNGWNGSDYTTAGDFISVATMKSYWKDLPLSQRESHGSASTPANNVSWFCYSSTDYSIDPLTTVTPGYNTTIASGSGVTFTNQLKNNGPDDKTVNDGFWRVFTFIVPEGQALPTGPRNSSKDVTSTAGINSVYYAGADVAKNYQWIGSSSSSGSCPTYDASMKLGKTKTRTSCITNERTTSSSYVLKDGDRICAAMLVTLYKPYVDGRRYSAPACVTVTAVAQNVLSCSATMNGGSIRTPRTYKITATGTTKAPNGVAGTITGPGFSQSLAAPTISGTALTISSSFTPVVAGSYAISATATDDEGHSVPCAASTTVGYQPYFTVIGGDILGGFDAADSVIASWNSDSAPYTGAGTTLAAIAGNKDIHSFITSANDLSSGPSRLAFANTPASSAPTYGGQFTATPTEPGYYDNATGTDRGCVLPATLNTLSSGLYTCSGDITLNGGAVPAGVNATIRTTGNVFIAGNITYAPHDLTNIPRLTVIAKSGNVIVSSAVTEMHGVFIAQSTATGGGLFYSCGSSPTNPFGYGINGINNNAQCYDNTLTVYGSVVADELILGRTKGSWTDVTPVPAETFIYSPETWLSKPVTSGTSQVKFDSYISLPPVL